MITKQDIQKMIKHVARRSRNIPDRRLLRPRREWVIAILGFLVVVSIGGTFSAERFHYLRNIDEHVEDNSLDVVEYKQGTMKKVIDHYLSRQEKFSQLQSGIAPVLVEDEVASSSVDKATTTPVYATTTTTITDEQISGELESEISTTSSDTDSNL